MHNRIHALYQLTLEKYKKYHLRLRKNLSSGRYHTFSNRKKQQIVHKIEKLRARLARLKWQLRVAMASGLIAATSIGTETTAQQLGPFVENTIDNPLPPIAIIGSNKRIDFADMDGDGDLDLIMGTTSSSVLQYYENTGTRTSPQYTQRIGTQNPFDGISAGTLPAPFAADFDGDKDIDIALSYFSATIEDNIRFLENRDIDRDGAIGEPSFVELVDFPTPVSGVRGDNFNVISTFVDLDNDQVLEAFAGSNSGSVNPESLSFFVYSDTQEQYIKTDLPAGLESFTQNQSYNVAPTFSDVDEDGDFDLIVGTTDGTIRYFRNNDLDDDILGNNYSFTELVGTENPFEGIDAGSNATPTFADIDGDEDDDLIIGNLSRSNPIAFYEKQDGAFTLNTDLKPFGGVDVGYGATPSFVDIDDDGDMDAFIGGKYGYSTGYVKFYKNTGNSFAEVTDDENPVSELRNGFPNPSFVDIDGDEDFDLFLDAYDDITFSENIGSPTSVALGGQNNTLLNANLEGLSRYYKTTFADIDEDGDLDAIIGHEPYPGTTSLEFHRNTGTLQSPKFELDQTNNPFIDLTEDELSLRPVPEFVDIDHDGDQDLFVGTTSGNVLFFLNTEEGKFDVSLDQTLNPLAGASVIYRAAPAFADIDQDGDLDAFIGNQNGNIIYFENQNLPPAINGLSSTTFTENDAPVPVAAALNIADTDNDLIIGARISVPVNYQAGDDILAFTPQAGVTGTFDVTSGILNLTGTASIDTYQTLLRSITFQSTGERIVSGVRIITMSVTDYDATTPTPVSTEVNVVSVNDVPVVTTSSYTVPAGGTLEIDLCSLINDPDNEFAELNISAIGTRPEVSLTVSGCILTLDYSQSGFSGTDSITIRACDGTDCAENSITVEVEGDNPGPLEVYTAVSPNGDGLNDWWEILKLSTPNKIDLYNRWGDNVKSITDYVSQENNQLDDLPAGTYFYKIESPQGSYTGYLVIKK